MSRSRGKTDGQPVRSSRQPQPPVANRMLLLVSAVLLFCWLAFLTALVIWGLALLQFQQASAKRDPAAMKAADAVKPAASASPLTSLCWGLEPDCDGQPNSRNDARIPRYMPHRLVLLWDLHVTYLLIRLVNL